VYTDGACINNGKLHPVGGIGVFFGEGDARNVSRRVFPSEEKITNQTMELLACCEAIETFYGSETADDALLCVFSDSEYVVKAMNSWVRGWERAGWKTSTGKPVSNLGLVKKLHALRLAHNVRFVHVSAHRAPPAPGRPQWEHRRWKGNMCADELARASVRHKRCS